MDLARTIEELVDANRILSDFGIVDGFGHVSVRHPTREDVFLISDSRAPCLVTADDVIECGMDGEPLRGTVKRTYIERYIHSAIYRRRPDVRAVVHSHAPEVIPFGICQHRLMPTFHMAGFLSQRTPVFEIREVVGDGSNLLVTNAETGDALARELGAESVVLMRGHGMTVAGPSLALACFRAVYTKINAQVQIWSSNMGPANTLTEAECRSITATSNDASIARTWDLWRQRVRRM